MGIAILKDQPISASACELLMRLLTEHFCMEPADQRTLTDARNYLQQVCYERNINGANLDVAFGDHNTLLIVERS